MTFKLLMRNLRQYEIPYGVAKDGGSGKITHIVFYIGSRIIRFDCITKVMFVMSGTNVVETIPNNLTFEQIVVLYR